MTDLISIQSKLMIFFLYQTAINMLSSRFIISGGQLNRFVRLNKYYPC